MAKLSEWHSLEVTGPHVFVALVKAEISGKWRGVEFSTDRLLSHRRVPTGRGGFTRSWPHIAPTSLRSCTSYSTQFSTSLWVLLYVRVEGHRHLTQVSFYSYRTNSCYNQFNFCEEVHKNGGINTAAYFWCTFMVLLRQHSMRNVNVKIPEFVSEGVLWFYIIDKINTGQVPVWKMWLSVYVSL